MTDATIASEVQVFAGLTGFPRVSFTTLVGGIASAGLVASVVALVISARAPQSASLPAVLPPHQAAGALANDDQHAAAPRAARRPGVSLDVAKTWIEEQHSIAAALNSEAHRYLAHSWSPAGGLSMLLLNSLQSAAPGSPPPQVASQPTKMEASVPLPQPSPIARLKFVPRQNVDRNSPVQSAPQIAAIPPSPQHNFFDFFRNLFAPHSDGAAQAILAANPHSAVYDIEAHVVYLPNGEKLEAHSGYGQWLDDPTSISRKDLGVTPPNVYAISYRAQLFHGVRALRLTPIGSGNMYGRDGMLAHTYMLGPNGQSNGCVSFKDYQKFLHAFEDGEVKQLIVMPSIDSAPPSRIASSQPGNA